MIMVGNPKTGRDAGHIRIYKTQQALHSAITQLKRRGYNYFTTFRDVQGPAVSLASLPEWIDGGVHSRWPAYETDRNRPDVVNIHLNRYKERTKVS